MNRLVSLTWCLSLAIAACGGAPDTSDDLGLDETGLTSSNGLSTNGLSTNGLSTNGLSTNGLSTNGLSTNGLSTNGFNAWFIGQAGGTAYTNMVMTYVVRCALPAGKSLSFTTGGVKYTWPGNLGLAPTWASGQPISLVEKQLVSACLAAHANKYGVQVPLSVRGFYKDGTAIAASTAELSAYSVNEGCFFGNLFDGDGVYSGYDPSALGDTSNSSYRACAWSNGGPGQCPNVVSTGKQCISTCTLSYSPYTGVWQSCTWNGKSYPAITTRIQTTSMNFCGDGICQATESCYNATTHLGCQTDCGKCP